MLGIAAIAMLAYVIYRVMKLRPVKKKEVQKPAARKINMTPDVLYRIKGQYVGKVQALINAYRQNTISKRDGYQQLSAIIRSFVHEVTGINVENYTVTEIKAFGMKKLDALMEEYYVPEFAEDEKAQDKNFEASCYNALGVIKTWS